MALTYYIRSWDPRSTYPTNPQDGDICYTITLDQTWAPVGGVKKDNIVKEEVYQNGAWVEQGGGGGSTLTTLYDGDYESELGPGFALCALTMDTTIETEPAELSVIYGGEEYTLPKIQGIAGYGEMDGRTPSFENYPVAINLTGDVGYDTILLFTEQAESGSIIVSAGGGSTSLYTDCVVKLNKTAGVSGYSVVALPSVEKNPNAPTYGIVGECIYTDASWSGGSYICPLYDGNLTIFITYTSSDKFQVASGDATTSVDGKKVYVHGDCTIDIIADK